MTAPTKNVVDLTVAGSGTLVSTDKVLVVDVSDTTEGPLGTVKIATAATLSALFNTLTTAGLLSVNNNGLVHVNASGALTSATNATLTSTGLAVTGTLSATGNISSSGYGLFTGIVSVGNATPVYQLDLNTTGSNTLFGAGISASTTPGPMTLSINSWGQAGGRTGVITFVTGGVSNGVEAARITSDAYLRMASGSGGIQFNGDTAAANALDDYEEGSWTPAWGVASGSISTNAYASGKYCKIGRNVYIWGFISSEALSAASGAVTITGLPFTAGNGFGQSGNQGGGGVVTEAGLWGSNHPQSVNIPAGGTSLTPYRSGGASMVQTIASDLSANANYNQTTFVAQYMTA